MEMHPNPILSSYIYYFLCTVDRQSIDRGMHTQFGTHGFGPTESLSHLEGVGGWKVHKEYEL